MSAVLADVYRSFTEAWANRRAPTPAVGGRSLGPEHGREWLCLLDVDGATADALAAVADRLDALDGVSGHVREDLHVTLKLVGFDDELDREAVDALATAVDLDIGPFTVAFLRLNVFSAAVVAEAHASELRAIHDTLAAVEGMPSFAIDGPQYLPHASLAGFETDTGYERAVAFVERGRDLDVPSLRVDAVRLVELGPGENVGDGTVLRTYRL